MRVKASSLPLAARRNRTSSLSCSAILISPDKTFCPLSCITSRRAVKKFPFQGVTRVTGLQIFVFTIVWTRLRAAGCRAMAFDFQNGRTTTYAYDDADWLTSVTDAATPGG